MAEEMRGIVPAWHAEVIADAEDGGRKPWASSTSVKDRPDTSPPPTTTPSPS